MKQQSPSETDATKEISKRKGRRREDSLSWVHRRSCSMDSGVTGALIIPGTKVLRNNNGWSRSRSSPGGRSSNDKYQEAGKATDNTTRKMYPAPSDSMTSFQPYDRRKGGIDLYSSGFGPRRVGQPNLRGLGTQDTWEKEYETLFG